VEGVMDRCKYCDKQLSKKAQIKSRDICPTYASKMDLVIKLVSIGRRIKSGVTK
jgi:hypothetical protein